MVCFTITCAHISYKEDTGKFNGWYDDAVHKTIPTPNIQVTEEEYQSHYTTMVNGKELIVSGGQITFQDIIPVITWDEIRAERNLLLTQSDWTQIPDAELTPDQQNAWKEYRKELRRIPETFQTPDQVVWPSKPQ